MRASCWLWLAACGSVNAAPEPRGAAEIGIGVRHDPTWVTHHGGPGDDEVLAIAVADATVYLAGKTTSSWFRPFEDACDPGIPAQHAGEDCGDAFIANLATGGGVQFGKRQADEVKCIAVADGALVACGNAREPASGNYQKDGFLVRYPLELGAPMWSVTIENAGRVDELMGVAIQGAVFASGGSNAAVAGHPVQAEDNVVMRVTLDGVTESTLQLGGAGLDELQAIAADGDGVYSVGTAGGDLAGPNQGSSDVVLVVHDLQLVERCRVQLGTKGKDVGQSVIALGGNIYVAGYTEGRLAGDLANGARCNQDERGTPDAARSDAFVTRYDAQCRHVWTREFGTAETDFASAIASDGARLYVTGIYGSAAAAHDGTTGAHAFLREYDLDGNVAGEVVFDSGPQTSEIGQTVAVAGGFVYVAGGTDGVLGTAPSLGGRDAFLAKVPIAAITGTANASGDGCD
jgi:hypothetical protein